MEELRIIIILAYIVATLISGTVGFGGFLVFFGLISIWGIEPTELFFLGAAAGIAKSISSGYFFRSHIPWKVTIKIFFTALPFLIAGGLLTSSLSPEMVRKMIGLFSVGYVVWKFLGKNNSKPLSELQTNIWAASWGFFSGLIGAGGPLVVALLSHLKLPKEAFIAGLKILFIASLSVKAVLYFPIESDYTKDFSLLIIMSAIALVGGFLGQQLNKKIPQKMFENAVLVLLLATGVKMMI